MAALLWVSGLAPSEVFAFVEKCGFDVDVNCAISMRFDGGAVGTALVGGYGHSVTEVLRIVGDRASARIFFRTVREQSLEINGEAVDAKASVALSTPNANFLDAIRGTAAVVSSGELGLRVARFTDAVYRSAGEGKPVGMTKGGADTHR
jgi:predicted dehydrogenase